MDRIRRTAAALAGAVGLAVLPATARADLIVQYSTNSGAAWTTICDVPSGTACPTLSTTLGGFTLTKLDAQSNSPGDPGLAQVLSSTIAIRNTSAGTASIWFRIGDQGFLRPTSGGLISAIGGTVNPGNASIAFQSCVDQSNTILSSVGPTCGAGTITPGLQTPAIIATSYNSSAGVGVNVVPGYAIDQVVQLNNVTAGAIVQFTGNSTVTTPEPGSMMLLGTGMFGLVGYVRRRRASM